MNASSVSRCPKNFSKRSMFGKWSKKRSLKRPKRLDVFLGQPLTGKTYMICLYPRNAHDTEFGKLPSILLGEETNSRSVGRPWVVFSQTCTTEHLHTHRRSSGSSDCPTLLEVAFWSPEVSVEGNNIDLSQKDQATEPSSRRT